VSTRLAAFAALAAFAILVTAVASAAPSFAPHFRISTTVDETTAGRVATFAAVDHNAATGGFLAVWTGDGLTTADEQEVWGQRLGPNGAEVGPDFRISTTGPDGDVNWPARNPEVAADDEAGRYLAVWEAATAEGTSSAVPEEPEIRGQLMAGDGTVLKNDFAISNGSQSLSEGLAAAAYNPVTNQYLVVWFSNRGLPGNYSEIWGRLVDASGTVLGSDDFKISDIANSGTTAVSPQAAYADVAVNSAGEYLVAFQGFGVPGEAKAEAFIHRVSSAGVPQGIDGRVSTTAGAGGSANPDVAYNAQADRYLVAWRSSTLGQSDLEIYGQLLNANAAEVGGDFRLSEVAATGGPTDPAVSAAGPHWLVVWGQAYGTESEVAGQEVAADGSDVGGDTRITNFGPAGNTAYGVQFPDVTGVPAQGAWLTVFTGSQTGPHADIFGAMAGAGGPGGPGPPGGGSLPNPTRGRLVNAFPVRGRVLISLPPGSARAAQVKGRRFVPLEEARQIPVGSLLDTRRGTVRLVSAVDAAGNRTQSGDFTSGIFQVLQSRAARAKGLTELRLTGSSFSKCAARRGKRAGAAALSRRTIRKLKSNAKGRFRSRGRHSAATVRGTAWLTADRCDGTLTKVTRGRVAVRDFRRKRTVVVRAGKSYLARARR
jgi:hypothetical protein